MKKYYIAVTYEVCEHNNLYLDMNEYNIEASEDMDKQIRELAKVDVAPVVKVYESDTSDFKEFRLYKEYKFKEYECGCNSSEY
ncbi:hypothetical protein QF028_002439 [Neobacillus sp. B4I6]|jgi:hypothetical protein|uniref:hypothetical protein n=1 Tax=Neobacillus sp. B4I6 TaxID=3373925 RepID=UPI003D1DB11E